MLTLTRLVLRIGIFVIAVAIVVVAFAGIGGIGAAEKLFGFKVPFQTTATDRSQPALLRSIQDISQYHAAVGNFQVVVDVEEDVAWVPSVLAGERSLFVAAGTVSAYVDFSGLADGDLTLSEDGQSVTIGLPEGKLDEPNLDNDRTYMFSQDRGVFDRASDAFSSQDQSDLYALAEQKLVSAAEESELTQQAEENTRAMLIGMLNSLDIQVTFTDEAGPE